MAFWVTDKYAAARLRTTASSVYAAMVSSLLRETHAVVRRATTAVLHYAAKVSSASETLAVARRHTFKACSCAAMGTSPSEPAAVGPTVTCLLQAQFAAMETLALETRAAVRHLTTMSSKVAVPVGA